MLRDVDILLYVANLVPVGKDQMQHLEMTRDVASRFNHALGETFVLPEALTQEATMYVPGLDGGKMSKSRHNTLNIFDDPKALKKRINKEIVTDATPLEDPKNPEANVIHSLYRLMASEGQADEMASALQAGGYGWGHAKKALLEALVDGFAEERARFHELMADKRQIDEALAQGAEKARAVAADVLSRVRHASGY